MFGDGAVGKWVREGKARSSAAAGRVKAIIS